MCVACAQALRYLLNTHYVPWYNTTDSTSMHHDCRMNQPPHHASLSFCPGSLAPQWPGSVGHCGYVYARSIRVVGEWYLCVSPDWPLSPYRLVGMILITQAERLHTWSMHISTGGQIMATTLFDGVLLFVLCAIVSGALFGFVQGSGTLRRTWRGRTAAATMARTIALHMCAPLVNLFAIFLLALFWNESLPGTVVPLTVAGIALLVPLVEIVRRAPYTMLHCGLLLQGGAQWLGLAAMLALPQGENGWMIFWSGAVWYAALWGQQQIDALLRHGGQP